MGWMQGGVRAPGVLAIARLGILRSYPGTLATLPSVRERLLSVIRRWPEAEDLVRQLVTFPTHSLLDAQDRDAFTRLCRNAH